MSVVQNLLPRVNAFMETGRCSSVSSVAMIVTALMGECVGLYKEPEDSIALTWYSKTFLTWRWLPYQTEAGLFLAFIPSGLNQITYQPRTSENVSLHRFCCVVERTSDVFVKTINTLAVALFFKKRFGAPAAVITGIATGALSAYNMHLSWHNMPKIRGDEIS